MIEVREVSKCYRLGAAATSLREAVPQLAGRLLGRRPAPREEFWALREVSFQVAPGELVGVIGPNGAGKSTLFKLLARITRPTAGSLRTAGRMAALIELGAGFHPDLTGRENVLLNGAMLGLRRAEIARRFEAIVAFAGLEPFIDTPIKRYSSGMYLRLAFAIAAHVEADLLLVDEMLAVGDTAFQAKCLARMRELHQAGTTVVLVSHDTWTVQRFCRRALLLAGGRLVADGEPEAVVERYQELLRNEAPEPAATARADDAGQGEGLRVELLDDGGEPEGELAFGGTLTVRVHSTAPCPPGALLVLRIRRSDGLLCCALNSRDGAEARPLSSGAERFQARIGPLPLVPDFYRVEALLIDGAEPLIYATGSSGLFRVRGALVNARDAGVFAPDVVWSHDEGSGASASPWADATSNGRGR